jgi:hypothetical protein
MVQDEWEKVKVDKIIENLMPSAHRIKGVSSSGRIIRKIAFLCVAFSL